MTWNRGRTFAVGGLAAGALAALVAVLSALAAPASGVEAARATLTSHTTAFGGGRVVVRVLPGGATCYTVTESSGSAHACRVHLGARELGFAVSPRGIGGVAGAEVRAVIVKLTRRGTVWASLHGGVFYAGVPPAYRVRAVVKVLRDGTRKAFAVTPSP